MTQDGNIVGANNFPSLVDDAASIHSHMIGIFNDVCARYGTRFSEALYQKAIARRAYIDMLPIMTERELFVDLGEGSLLVGRVDFEVARKCLYELKIGNSNVTKDSEQVKKYLTAYDLNQETIEIAAVVYFTNHGVEVHVVRNKSRDDLCSTDGPAPP